jgi:hypothetical protein
MSRFLGRFHGRRSDADLDGFVDAVVAALRARAPALVAISVAHDDPYCVVAHATTVRRTKQRVDPEEGPE